MSDETNDAPRRMRILAGTAARLALSPLGPLASPAVHALEKLVIEPIFDHLEGSRQRRLQAFALTFMESGDPDTSAQMLVAAEVSRAPNETKDAILSVVRALEDVVCDAVVPALAVLAREYQRVGRPKDRFLIGTTRLLRDFESHEFEALRTLSNLTVVPSTLMTSPLPLVEKTAVGERTMLLVHPDRESDWLPEYDAVFQALTVHGFAEVNVGWGGDASLGGWKLSPEPWARLARLLWPNS